MTNLPLLPYPLPVPLSLTHSHGESLPRESGGGELPPRLLRRPAARRRPSSTSSLSPRPSTPTAPPHAPTRIPCSAALPEALHSSSSPRLIPVDGHPCPRVGARRRSESGAGWAARLLGHRRVVEGAWAAQRVGSGGAGCRTSSRTHEAVVLSFGGRREALQEEGDNSSSCCDAA